MNLRRFTVLTLAIGCVAASASAQMGGNNKLSPHEQTSVTIDGKSISVKYSAPSVRGRKIFGEHEPYGKVWRAGADEATSLHTDADLDLGGLAVPKGDYTLYVLPNQDGWKLIVNKQTGQWGTEYSQDQDLGRVDMKMTKPASMVEMYKITLATAGHSKGTLQLEWENTVAMVPFTVK